MELGVATAVNSRLQPLKRRDEVPTGANVVCVLTGNGLKDPDCAINNNDAAFHTDLNPDLATVADVMGF